MDEDKGGELFCYLVYAKIFDIDTSLQYEYTQ